MSTPTDRRYAESHEWLLDLGDGRFRIGLTDFAQTSLGDIVYFDLPGVGDAVTAGKSFGDVESVKTVSEMISPVTGAVSAVNTVLDASPELVNADPYENWVIEVSDVTDTMPMLSSDEYDAIAHD